MGTRKRTPADLPELPSEPHTPATRHTTSALRATPRPASATRVTPRPASAPPPSATPAHTTSREQQATAAHAEQLHQRIAAARALAAAPTPAIPAARPGPATNSGRRHFGELREALAEGWEIVQPIFARPLWSTADDSATAFNFVLHSPHGTRLITVPQGRLVERFIRDRRLAVDYAR
jgi:hypothetical protein